LKVLTSRGSNSTKGPMMSGQASARIQFFDQVLLNGVCENMSLPVLTNRYSASPTCPPPEKNLKLCLKCTLCLQDEQDQWAVSM
jgi:hypothetical protein